MVESTIARLESSFNLLAPRGDELVDRFYAHLFSANPQLRSLFPKDMAEQKGKLLASLGLVTQNLRQPDRLRQPLLEMGKRHLGYQAQEEHYPVVRDTLIAVMAEMAGQQWNAQLTADWQGAIDGIAAIMLEGQKLAGATPPPTAS